MIGRFFKGLSFLDVSDSSMLWLALFILLVVSAFFSGSETGMMSLNRYRLRHQRKKSSGARRAAKLLATPDRLIGLILIGNNAVNILAAIIANALAIIYVGEAAAPWVATATLTILVLVFAEVTPKTIAAQYPEWFAFKASHILKPLLTIFWPLVWAINKLTNGLVKLLGFDPNSSRDDGLDTEELRSVVDLSGHKMSDSHQGMLKGILDLENVAVEDIMIPHHELVSADANDEDELFEQFKRIQHNRLLLFEGSENNIIGTIHMRDILNIYAKEEINLSKIKECIREPYFIPEGTPLSQQLEHFKKQKRRLGIVVDEYGEVKGMVVLDDILEEIVGQFTSSQGETIEEIQIQSDGSYLVDPRVSIREINTELNVKLPFDSAKTLNGLILEQLQSFPQHNLSLKIDSLIIEIIQVSKQGIKLVKITKIN